MALAETALQLIVAAIIVITLYIITLVVLNIDALVASPIVSVKPREKIDIVDGYSNVSGLANKSFNTINQFAPNFIKIPRSINTSGGAQFTYQFWIKVVEANDDYFKNLPIIHKGDTTLYNIGLYPYVNSVTDKSSTNMLIKRGPEAFIRCPLIKFGDSWRHLVVQFNTTANPFNTINIQMNQEGGPAMRRNLLSLLPINWYLMTFTFQDNYSPVESADNGIKFTFWLNDVPYQTNSASTDLGLRNVHLKQNDGDLHLFPQPLSVNGEFLKVGDIKYYNYAVTESEIKSIFKAGPPTKPAQISRTDTHQPAYITAYNKLDIYNN